MSETILIILIILKYLIIAYLIYVILCCLIAYLKPARIDNVLKAKLDCQNFYGDKSNENERILLIEEPCDALSIRMNMIRSAEKTLDISYHNLQAGNTTPAFLGELLEAADRGVHIRLVIDAKIGIGEKATKYGIRALESHERISVRGYAPLNLLKPWEFPVVLHDKFIIADDEYLLLGGRNIGDRYFAPNGYDKPVTNDRDVFIWCKDEGDNSIRQVRKYMELLWNSKNTQNVWKPYEQEEKRNMYENMLISKLDTVERENAECFGLTLDDYKEQTVATNKITLIHNPINTAKKKPALAYQLRHLALTAKNNVFLQTPYATANKHLLLLMEEVSKGVSMTFLTNSKASTPNFIAYSTYSSRRKKFVATGASIYELQSTDSIHGKSMSVDDRVSAVGSFNMDDRSFYVDTETMLIIDSPEFTAMLNSAMETYISRSLQVDLDNKYIRNLQVNETPVSLSRKVALRLISVPSRLLQIFI